MKADLYWQYSQTNVQVASNSRWNNTGLHSPPSTKKWQAIEHFKFL